MKKTLWTLLFCVLPFAALGADLGNMEQVFKLVEQEYIEPDMLKKAAMATIKGLEKIDKNIKLSVTDNNMAMYYKAKLIRNLKMPPANASVPEWSKFAAMAMDLAASLSPQAKHHDFELSSLMLREGFKHFDGVSAYYADVQNLDEQFKFKNSFSERMFGNLLYMKISTFNRHTKNYIEKSIAEHPDAAGIILDLKGNPGGILSQAIEAADIFLEEGIIVSLRGRNSDSDVFYAAVKGGVGEKYPLVVLVDENTASSAEVLALAIKDQGRGAVLGTYTKGKQTVQNLWTFANGGALALTSAVFYGPSGETVGKEGVVPSVCTYKVMERINIEQLINISCGHENRENLDLDMHLSVDFLNFTD